MTGEGGGDWKNRQKGGGGRKEGEERRRKCGKRGGGGGGEKKMRVSNGAQWLSHNIDSVTWITHLLGNVGLGISVGLSLGSGDPSGQ